MPSKSKKAAAARARASRHPQHLSASPSPFPSELAPEDTDPVELQQHAEPIDGFCIELDDSDSSPECEYAGGVNYEASGSDCECNDDTDLLSDDDTLSELDGDELEANLQSLRAELEDLAKPTAYEKICSVGPKHWAQAETNRALGYTGNSSRTKERREQEKREQERQKEAAKTS